MPSKATTDALIRLRRAEELESMRGLNRAREGVERATRVRETASGELTKLEKRLETLSSTTTRTRSGTLAQRDLFRAQLRKQRDAVKARLKTAERGVDAALRAREAAQRTLEQALRGREAAEARRDAGETAEARRRERRDQAASDDGWRPPRR